ncbi:hypothetical protein TvY486_0003750 [Trypanosoma vivax Y486]|uniref:Uncharacterized protein n=1 Tax=Trypanosoma vivax (strain Y486) TaxID=1055687 RepID=F9WUZ5_TRYVY|nr:hypothetical protein TvY486_0003750 [Trypanosoma vivax Y486]|eukprot:CCD21395.1 hypothetical protein TvY486_0003750 [Trypanosoma vivax Y486]
MKCLVLTFSLYLILLPTVVVTFEDLCALKDERTAALCILRKRLTAVPHTIRTIFSHTTERRKFFDAKLYNVKRTIKAVRQVAGMMEVDANDEAMFWSIAFLNVSVLLGNLKHPKTNIDKFSSVYTADWLAGMSEDLGASSLLGRALGMIDAEVGKVCRGSAPHGGYMVFGAYAWKDEGPQCVGQNGFKERVCVDGPPFLVNSASLMEAVVNYKNKMDDDTVVDSSAGCSSGTNGFKVKTHGESAASFEHALREVVDQLRGLEMMSAAVENAIRKIDVIETNVHHVILDVQTQAIQFRIEKAYNIKGLGPTPKGSFGLNASVAHDVRGITMVLLFLGAQIFQSHVPLNVL